MKIQGVLKVKNARKLLIILAIFISSILLKVTLSDSFNVLNYLTVTIGLIIGTEIFILKDRYLNIKNNFFKSIFQRIYASEFISEVSDKTCFFIKKWKSIFKRNDKKNQDIIFRDKDKLFEQFDSDANEIIVLYINICSFNEINTIFGYEIGNKLLLSFAERLNNNYFDCYRTHGDEFVVISYNKATDLEIDTFSNYVFDLLSKEPFKIENEEIFLTVHIGIAIINNETANESLNISSLIYKANIAMKYAKLKQVQYAVYSPDLMKDSGDNQEYFVKKQIISAINNNNIFAVYQPIIDNKTQKVVKYESLIRINGVDNNTISPSSFLKLSKQCNLYNHLTKFMINEVFNKLLTTDIDISINISINDIMNLSTNNLITNKLKKMPQEKRQKLIFELLESEEIENYSQVEEFINTVKSYGCKVAIDDFGSGYSNFNRILNLNIDYLKIDASIIKNILNDKTSETIVKFIIDLTRDMNIKTIAEFVHSKEIFEKVKELGIDYSQGFYISEPIILHEI